MDVTAEEVFIGNGVSELIDLSLRALLNPGDEVLVPSPDYPLWSAAVALNLLESKHVLVAPGSSFNTPYSDHFRITTLPDPDVIKDVFSRMDSLLEQHVELHA